MSDKEKILTIVNLYMAEKVGSLSAEEFTKLYLDTEVAVANAYYDYYRGDSETPDIGVQVYD